MLIISGSLYNSESDFVDDQSPLTVTSCGHYSLIKRPRFVTNRPAGRKDYQLLYFLNGKGSFVHEGNTITVPEGHVFIYYPGEPQYYEYYLSDSPDLYWIHFTGNDIPGILDRLSLSSSRLHRVKVKDTYRNLFDKIIRELQLKQNHFDKLANIYFYELLTLMSRAAMEDSQQQNIYKYEQIERAIQVFHTEYKMPFSIEDYARQCNMSVSWFARVFRRQTGLSPQNYLTNVRINKAKELLASSSYNIGEIAEIVGYQNPLYFSRIFKKYTGFSPSEYKRKHS